MTQAVKNPPAMQEMQETQVRSLDWDDPLEKVMATHSRILAWRIPWTEEPGGLQPLGSRRVGHNWATSHSGINWWKGLGIWCGYLVLFRYMHKMGFLGGSVVKNLPAIQETWVWSLGREDPLEKETATHSSILAWEIPWTEEPGGLQLMESQGVGHDWTD